MDFETIRIFISSTFSDMHAERDYLVGYVFPRLREWCEKRRLYLMDIDLRWGITQADSDAENTIRVCLDNVDACRPFFLCLLGQRRGTVFGCDHISRESFEEYPELREKGDTFSVTELEIEHALLAPMLRIVNEKEIRPERVRRALFFLRDDPFRGVDLPKTHRKIYTNAGAADPQDAEEKTRAFREHIRTNCGHVTAYQCRFDPAKLTPELRGYPPADSFSPPAEQGRLVDFTVQGEPLCDVIIRQLQELILQEYPDRRLEAEDQQLSEEEIQTLTRARFTEFFLRREGDFDPLSDYLLSGSGHALLLTAPGGAGKSALLTGFAKEAEGPGTNGYRVILRFCGISSGSLRFTDVLRAVFAGEGMNLPPDDESFRNGLEAFYAALSGSGKLLLLLDDITRTTEGIDALKLLPGTLPANVRMIVSLRESPGDLPLIEAHAQRLKAGVTHLRPFGAEDKNRLIQGYLSKNLKALDDPHREYLCSLPSTENPLYLNIILRELRTFGSFEQLREELERFGGTPEEAFLHLLDRLKEKAYDLFGDMGSVSDRLFGLLGFSRAGIRKQDLMALLSGPFGPGCEELVEYLLKCARDYLSGVVYADSGSRIDFLYDSFRRACQVRFRKEENVLRNALADVFEESDPEECSWQLRHAGNTARLKELYANPGFLSCFALHSGGWGMLREADLLPPGILTSELSGCLHVCVQALSEHSRKAPQILYKEVSDPVFRQRARELIHGSWLRFEPEGGADPQVDENLQERTDLAPALENRHETGAAASVRCFSPGADLAFLLLRPGMVTVFRMSTVERLFEMPLEEREPEKILATDDGRYFATAGSDGTLSVYELVRNDSSFLLRPAIQAQCLKIRFRGICAYAAGHALVWQNRERRLVVWQDGHAEETGEQAAQLAGAWDGGKLITAWKEAGGWSLRSGTASLSLDAAVNDVIPWKGRWYIAVRKNVVYAADPDSLKILDTIPTENPLYCFAADSGRLFATDEEYALEMILRSGSAVSLGNTNYANGSVHTLSFEHIRSIPGGIFYCSDSVCARLVLKTGEQTHARERFLNAVREEDQQAVYDRFEGQYHECQAGDLTYRIENRKTLAAYTADGRKVGSASLDESQSGQYMLIPVGRRVAVLTLRASIRKLFSSMIRSVLEVYEEGKRVHRTEYLPDENIVAAYPDGRCLWVRGSGGFEIIDCGRGFTKRKIPFGFEGFSVNAPVLVADATPVLFRDETRELCVVSGENGRILASYPMSRSIDSLERGEDGALCRVTEHGTGTYQLYLEETP